MPRSEPRMPEKWVAIRVGTVTGNSKNYLGTARTHEIMSVVSCWVERTYEFGHPMCQHGFDQFVATTVFSLRSFQKIKRNHLKIF